MTIACSIMVKLPIDNTRNISGLTNSKDSPIVKATFSGISFIFPTSYHHSFLTILPKVSTSTMRNLFSLIPIISNL